MRKPGKSAGGLAEIKRGATLTTTQLHKTAVRASWRLAAPFIIALALVFGGYGAFALLGDGGAAAPFQLKVVHAAAPAAPLPAPTDPILWGLPANAQELVASRTQNSKKFLNKDRTYTSILVNDLHYEAAPGVWDDVDLTFSPEGDNYAMRKHPRQNIVINPNGVDITRKVDGKGIRWYTPGKPVVRGANANYTEHSLAWTYEITNTGLKSSATVFTSRGPQTYTFTYMMLGGASDFTVDATGNAVGDGFFVPRPIVIGANGIIYQTGPWTDVAGPRLSFLFDDSILPPEAFPYVIDPTTTLQPDDGLDTEISDRDPNDNLSTAVTMYIGDNHATDADARRLLLEFDVSSIDSGDIVSNADLDLWEHAARDEEGTGSWAAELQRVRRDWIEAQATWNNWKTSNAWSTAGAGNTTNDIHSTISATLTLDGTAAGAFVQWSGSVLDTDVQNFVDGGYSNFGWRLAAPAAESHSSYSNNQFRSSEYATAGERPRLVVTHSTPTVTTVAVTGTMSPSGTEEQIRDGGNTIILTLSDDTWVASGATFDAQRQAIINGLTAGVTSSTGWNLSARDAFGVATVIRTSDTIATITVTGAGGLAIDVNETIAVTVPNAALVTSTLDVTGTSTFFASAGLETLILTGTLSDGATSSQIRVGGETLTYTISGTSVISASNFDVQRQAIINSIDSAGSAANGWDAEKSNLPLTNVVRTSGTVVTITLSALANYASATETLTALLNAGALNLSHPITGTPTFDITGAYHTSGNRVTQPIDLSGVTDVAYCALGWEATTPTNTTVTVETSINGGSTYSTGVNGSCPTGISVGASLATITDFRIRVNLTTTDTTITPTVETLALVIEDTSGQELYYQLNTTPGATLTDRSGNSHSGTMSFPIGITGVSSAVADLSPTREQLTTQAALTAPQVASAVTGTAISDNIFSTDEIGFVGLPGFGVVNAMASLPNNALPARFIWFIFLGVLIIGMGFIAMLTTQSLLAATIAMGAGIGFAGAVGGGLMPMWILFIFIPMSGAFILLRPKLPL